LPAVVTIALALGSRRMLQRHALIRKLPAVETLGSVTTICADKTGTLTENRMSVIVLDVANQRVDLRATPAIAATDGTSEIIQSSSALSLLLMGCALCNNVLPSSNSKASVTLEALGDPTEVALAAASARFGFQKAELNEQFPCVAEMPFASERKRMTTVHPIPSPQFQNLSILDSIWQWGRQGKASHIAFTKGAVDSLLEVCNYVWVKDRAEPLHAEWHDRITTSNSQSAQGGMRVLGVAFRLLEALPANGAAAIEQDLIFIGLIGMIDPPRPEVKTAVQTCSIAGIRPVMITGDHPLMAQYIAQAVGITNNHHVLTGLELSQLSLPELEAQVESVSIYARVSPQQKLNIVKALQNQGHIVAMTGDGINDAPALRKADIGVAMGMAGTDVSKEAADMVLLDDNFATIVAAVEEGRVIYDNIRKFIKYTLTGNAGGVWIMVLAPLLAMPLPLLPLQILWINLMADGLMALALSVEPSESNVMQRSPYSPQENIFGRGVGRGIIWVGFLVGLTILLMGYEYWLAGQPNWQTMVFTTLACSRASLALAMRSEHDSLFRLGLLTNKPILGAAAMTLILQIAVIYTPWLQTLFKTKALSVPELIICLGLSLVGFLGVELEKWIVRRRIALAASEHK
jgi:Ca2+-transporting ATPase